MSKMRQNALRPSPIQFKARLRLKTQNNVSKSSLQEVGSEKTLYAIKKLPQGTSLSDADKQKVYHKNIAKFRDVVTECRNTTLLPFLAQLRSTKHSDKRTEGNTVSPFETASKLTLNQKTRKRVGDLQADPSRMVNALYRWHNKSGKAVKDSCHFECKLRIYKETGNPESPIFRNTVTPIRYLLGEQRKYQKHLLICPKQQKTFPLQGN